ncbi:MAG: alpha-L-fucosidase [Opitutales bacterium]|nr:alpha-L-fucosidase [Opitutales bacterium]
MTTTATPLPARIQQFEDRAYGLFLHWGLYSLVGQGEWYRHHHRIPLDTYGALFQKFTAEGFDADALAKFARSVGFRYICLTTRHHDGFSLYDTRGLNTFDAPHSPAKRDLVAEFVTACRKHDLGVFFYHTTLDWWEPRFDSDWTGYQAYLRDSVRILCSEYGRIDGLWFDGNWSRRDRDWEEDALYGMIRELQPEAIIVNNSSIGNLGAVGHPQLDAVTFEQGLPAKRAAGARYVAKEMCETFNSHWGEALNDYSMKSPATLIETLAACRGAGANLLLNVAPRPDGSLPAYESAALEIMGRWIERCAPCLYTGRPADAAMRGRNFVLRSGDDHFAFIFHVPISNNMHLSHSERGDGLQTVEGELPEIAQVEWVDSGEALDFTQDTAKGMLTFRATPNPYGSQHVVRVARLRSR